MSAIDENEVGRTVDAFLAQQTLPVEPEHDCPYLPARAAQNEGFAVSQLPFEVYHSLMDRGFRRSGEVIYRPVCRSCDMCQQLRVPVETFVPSRSQRRVWRTNEEIEVTINENPKLSAMKWRLFRNYVAEQHDESMPTEYEDFERFLYRSPLETLEFSYRLGEEVVGISIADRGSLAMSSVYMFFDPAQARRSLGTYSVLWEIDFCRRSSIPYYYMGYYVAGSKTMDYKARFRPHEILQTDQTWRLATGSNNNHHGSTRD